MRIDEIEIMIMCEIYYLQKSNDEIVFSSLSNQRKRTIDESVICVTTILIFWFLEFFVSIANQSSFFDDFKFEFFDAQDDDSIFFEICMLVYSENKIF